MGQPVVHFEIVGKDPSRPRAYYGDLFGWEFAVGVEVAEGVSAPGTYGFVEKIPTPDGGRIPGGVVGGEGFESKVLVYVGVSDVEEAPRRAEALGGKRSSVRFSRPARRWWSGTSRTRRAT